MKNLILILFLITFTGSSQIYKGKLIDIQNQPISFADIIVVKENNKELITGVNSDDNGNFKLAVSSKVPFYIEISYIGFETLKINPTKTNLGEITLKEKATTLNEVVISARKKLIQQNGDKLFFNVENSLFSQGNSGAELLSQTPKVTSSDNGFKIKNKTALVLVNGRKLNMSSEELKSYLSSINSENIKRIEVQETADASQEGTTQNGVINIVLKNKYKGFKAMTKQAIYYFTKKNQKMFSYWNLEYGNKNFYTYAKGYFDKTRKSGESHTYFYYDDGDENLSKSIYENNRKNREVEFGGVYFINSKNEIGLSVSNNKYYNYYEEPGNYIIKKVNQLPVLSNGTSITDITTEKVFMMFNYKMKLDNKGSFLKILSDIGQNSILNNSSINVLYKDFTLLNNNTLVKGNFRADYVSSQIDYKQYFDNNYKVSFGLKINQIETENTQNNFLFENKKWIHQLVKDECFINSETIYAGYLSSSKKWGNHFLKLGIRTEKTNRKGLNNNTHKDIKKDYTNWFPSFYYRYDYNKNLSANFNYRKSIIRPSFSKLTPYVYKKNDFQYSEGNPNLKPYYKNSFNMSVDYKQHSLTLSYQKTMDYIRTISTTNSEKITVMKPTNIGVSKISSADYSFSGNLRTWLYFNFSTGLSYADYNLGQNNFSGFNWYEEIFLRAKISKNWLTSISQEYTSDLISFNNKILHNTSTNLMVQKKFMNDVFIARFTIKDIFNTKRTSVTSLYDTFYYNFYMKPNTRCFVFSLQYTFKNKGEINKKKIETSDENRRRL